MGSTPAARLAGIVASRKGNDHEDQRDPCERKRVMGCNAEELAAHQTCKAEREKDARQQAE